MLLEGKAAGVAVVGLAAIFAAFGSLPTMAQDLILAAAAIGALKIIGGALRSGLERAREVHAAVTSDLPERTDRIEHRLELGDQRFAAIESTLGTLALSERAAVRGALEATQQPRTARATDPGVRTGWRE